MAKAVATKQKVHADGPLGFVLFVAWIGAVVYFVQISNGFWGFIVALLKSIVWPAYVLHAVLRVLNVN